MSFEIICRDILCGVANGVRSSTSGSGRLTDHLSIGVLAGLIHRDIVDDVIRECGKREKRQRLLPAHVVMYYVLALNLFFGEAYEEVLRQLVNGLKFLGNWRDNWEIPSTSAISQARTRLGEAPMKLLFERIAVPMAGAGTRGAWYRGLRVMAIDGLVLDVPATDENDEEFGRSGATEAPSPFPQVRLVALGECGTHGVVDAAFGPVATGEQTLAGQLIARFVAGMLVLADRNFYSYQAWQQAAATGAQLLWRVSSNLRLPVLEWLPDGSYRSVLINPRIRGRRRERLLAAAAAGQDVDPAEAMVVRVAEYVIDNRPGGGELLGRTGAPCQDRSWWVSPARPPHPACDSHRTGRSTCLASGSAVGGGCRVRCPWGRDPAAAVAVAGDRDAGCAGEGDPVVGDPPSDVAEATSEFFHPEPVLARVLGPYPPHQPTPRVVVDRAEHVLGHPVPEVGRPPDQGLVETDDQLVQILVPG